MTTAWTQSRRARVALLSVLCVACLFGSRVLKITDHDVFLHIRYGQWILERREIPRTDTLSVFAEGKPWIDHEWLAQVLIAVGAAESIGGLTALCLLRAGVIVAAFLLCAMAMRRRGASFLPGLAVLFLGSMASWRFSEPRPYLATYAALAWLSWAWSARLVSLRSRIGAPSRALWLAPLVAIVWSNCHAGFAAGLAFLAALAVGATTQSVFRNWRREGGDGAAKAEARRLWILLGASAVAACLNPYGPRIFAFPLKIVGQKTLERILFEWNPPTFGFEFWPFVAYAALLAIALARRPRAVCAQDWLAALGFLWMSLNSRRHIPLLVFATMPLLAERISGNWKPAAAAAPAGGKRRTARVPLPASLSSKASILRVALEILRSRFLRSSAFAALFLFGAVWSWQMVARTYMPMGLGVNEKAQPVKAMDFLLASDLRPNLFHSYNIGGYVAWRIRPPWRHFIDGRADLYGAEGIARYFAWIAGKGNWRSAFESYAPPIETVLLDYDMAEKIDGLARSLANSREWALVYWDDFAMIYARRTGLSPAMLEHSEYRRVNPLSTPSELAERNPPGPQREALTAELLRRLREAPETARAMGFLSYLYSLDGRLDEAADLCRKILAIEPRAANAQLLLAKILEKKRDYTGAERAYRQVLRLKPDSSLAWTRLGTIYERQGKTKKALACYRRAMRESPADRDAVFNAARATAQLGRAKESLALWKRYLSLAPPDPETLDAVAQAYDDLGARAEAKDLREQASELRALLKAAGQRK